LLHHSFETAIMVKNAGIALSLS